MSDKDASKSQINADDRTKANPNSQARKSLTTPTPYSNNISIPALNSQDNIISDPYVSNFPQPDTRQYNPLGWQKTDPRKTDPLCEIIFYIIVILVVCIGIALFAKGDPKKLSAPIDPDGRICGVGELKDFPFIYFVTPSEEFMYRAVCVSKCPSLTEQPRKGAKLQCAPNSVVKSCEFKLLKGSDRREEVMIYDTTVYSEKLCMPRNVEYFKLVSEAMKMNQLQQSIKSIYDSALMIILFTIVAIALSISLKYLFENQSLANPSVPTFFIISTAGFFLLALLFIFRIISILFGPNPDQTKVIESVPILSGAITQFNSNLIINIIFAALSLFGGCIFIYYYITFESSNDAENKQIRDLRNKVINFVPEIVSVQKLIYIPIISIIICFFLFIFCFIMQVYGQAIGKISTDNPKDLPFQRFTQNFMIGICSLVLVILSFILFIFIGYATEFLSYALSYQYINRTVRGRRDIDTSQVPLELNQEVLHVFKYRIGTIMYSTLAFFFYPLRSFLEIIDTSVQRTHDKNRQMKAENKDQAQNNGCFWSLKCRISNFYNASFLKALQPYGFILTHAQQMEFIEAGFEVQRKIDNTYYWFEDMLDGGELFESSMKFSICFITTVAFYIVQTLMTDNILQVVPPTVVVIFSSYLVAHLFVTCYGSVFSTIILYCLLENMLTFKFDKQKPNVDQDSSIRELSQFVSFLTSSKKRNSQGAIQRVNSKDSHIQS